MKKRILFLILASMTVLVAGFYLLSNKPIRSFLDRPPGELREQVALGERIYNDNCVSCHGEDGVGSPNWRVKSADGKYPPPPLNGTAHTWHHPSKALIATIKRGGLSVGGSMPGFADKLSDQEIDAVVLHLINSWPPEVQEIWQRQVESQ